MPPELVSGNRLSGVSCYRIAEHLGGLSTLILADNCLDDDEGVVRIAESCPRLRRLDVGFTSITERGVDWEDWPGRPPQRRTSNHRRRPPTAI